VIAAFRVGFVVDQVRWALPEIHEDRAAIASLLLGASSEPRVRPISEVEQNGLAASFTQLEEASTKSMSIGKVLVAATELFWKLEALSGLMKRRRPRDVWKQPIGCCGVRPEVRTALALLRKTYRDAPGTLELARVVSLSDSAFRRAVTNATGVPPSEYLRQVRLQEFTRLVCQTNLPLAEAARRVGWSSSSHARASFSKAYGLSPRGLRETLLTDNAMPEAVLQNYLGVTSCFGGAATTLDLAFPSAGEFFR